MYQGVPVKNDLQPGEAVNTESLSHYQTVVLMSSIARIINTCYLAITMSKDRFKRTLGYQEITPAAGFQIKVPFRSATLPLIRWA